MLRRLHANTGAYRASPPGFSALSWIFENS